MKSAFVILLSFFLIADIALPQQDTVNRFHAIKTYPLNLVKVVEFNLAYETNFDAKNGMEFLIGTSMKDHVFYSSTNLLYWINSESNIADFQPSTNILTRISYKRYFGKDQLVVNKFFISPQVIFKYSWYEKIILESWQYCDWSEDNNYSNDPRTSHYPVFIFPSFYCGINFGMIWNKNR